MNTRIHFFTITLTMALIPAVFGQAFNSGSNGSYGPMEITSDTTLDLPPDGIFHCTTVNVAQGATLRFRRNALNTPVYLLAMGPVTIGGAIDISGQNGSQGYAGEGGPGGFDGGRGAASEGEAPSEGLGPGGGRINGASRAAAQSAQLWPMIGGSGGAGEWGNPGIGGGGGRRDDRRFE